MSASGRRPSKGRRASTWTFTRWKWIGWVSAVRLSDLPDLGGARRRGLGGRQVHVPLAELEQTRVHASGGVGAEQLEQAAERVAALVEGQGPHRDASGAGSGLPLLGQEQRGLPAVECGRGGLSGAWAPPSSGLETTYWSQGCRVLGPEAGPA